MRHRPIAGALALLMLAPAGPAPASAQAQAQAQAPAPDPAPPELPRWMAGCWIARHEGETRSEECWTMPRGAMMLGSGHMFAGPVTRSFEHMRIIREGDTLVFVAQPGGAPPTRFALEAHVAPGGDGPARLSFVNAANDYPQRVTYRLVAGGLEAEIAMLDGSRPMRWSFRRP
jgi:hypothetical protein